jgi:hypothetical protein
MNRILSKKKVKQAKTLKTRVGKGSQEAYWVWV